MTIYDDPNRQVVGLEPIWTGADTEPPAQPEPGADDGGFDPADHTVAEVQQYLVDHPDDAERVLALERAGKNRATLVGDG
jgi:hypothetical protein